IFVETESVLPELQKSHIILFLKHGNLGIMVPENWWDQVKASCPKPIEEQRRIGSVYLTLAKIPTNEFDVHWQQHGWSDRWDATSVRIKKRRDEQREELGWKADDSLSERWNSIKHSYFTLEDRAI